MKFPLYFTILAFISPTFAQSVNELPSIGANGKSTMDEMIKRRKEEAAKKAAAAKAKQEAEEAAKKAQAEADAKAKKEADEKAAKADAEALKSIIKAREAAGPEKASMHYIKPGGSLTAISEEAYGRTRYWRILKLYNKVDPNKLQVGQEIKAPNIPWLIASSGLQDRFPKVVTNLLETKKILTAIHDKKTAPTDEDLKKVQGAAGLITEAKNLLLKKTPGVSGKPNATITQLITVRTHLLHIANKTKKGRTDPNSLAHEHLSNSIVYAVLWAQGDFK